MALKKILITGISGFVGYHFLNYLIQNDSNVCVCGIDINLPVYDCTRYKEQIGLSVICINMLDLEELDRIIEEFKPEYILHLASYSSVAYSWSNPVESFINNTQIYLNLIHSVLNKCPNCKILSVGSSEEYGIVDPENIPLKEAEKLNPISPYAVARVSQEMLSKVFVQSYGLNIVMTRSFNHIGPYQDSRFVIAGFINKILEIKQAGETAGVIKTGDLSIVRDFVDVRDVADAYYRLLMFGKRGEIYNVCSGKGTSLKTMVELIANTINIDIKTKTDKSLLRPNDNPIIIGDASKIENELGWTKAILLEQTIVDMIKSQETRKC